MHELLLLLLLEKLKQ